MALHQQGPDGICLWYPTPVMVRVIPNTAAVNRRLREIILSRAQEKDTLGKSNVGGWHSRPDLFEWPYPEVKQLLEWVAQAVKSMTAFATDQPDVSGELEAKGWANVLGYGNYNAPHDHPNAMWSGVYYVDAGTYPEEHPDSGIIEFHDPRPAVDMLKIPGVAFSGKMKVNPQPGMLLMFPGWLSHFVNPYYGEGMRISLSFNVKIIGHNAA